MGRGSCQYHLRERVGSCQYHLRERVGGRSSTPGYHYEPLLAVSEPARAAKEESLCGEGTQGRIHKVDIGERLIVVTLLAQHPAPGGRLGTGGHYASCQRAHHRVRERSKNPPADAGGTDKSGATC